MSVFDWLLGKKKRQQKAQANGFPPSSFSQNHQAVLLNRPPTLPEAAYMLPKNEQEINRLDFQHFILRQVLRGNYIAPLQTPRTILDVGGGTERWCYEMAQTFPQASVIRCDRVETKSVVQGMPQNYKFVQADILNGLPFPDRYFDFVHQRLLFFSIPTVKWPQVLRELARVTAVGGWIEIVEMRDPGPEIGPHTKQAIRWLDEVSRRLGIDMARLNNLDNDLRQAGFMHLQSYSLPVPVGHWGGHLGAMMASNMMAMQQVFKPMIVAQLGIDPLQVDQNSAAEQREWEHVRGSLIFYAAYGQRST